MLAPKKEKVAYKMRVDQDFKNTQKHDVFAHALRGDLYSTHPQGALFKRIKRAQAQMLLATVDAIDTRMSLILMSDARTKGIEFDKLQKYKYIVSKFVERWSFMLGSRTFEFQCSAEESTYITRPEHAEKIHRYASTALYGSPCKLFIDAFACVGGDTLAAMNQFKEADIFAVQRTHASEQGRFERLQQNIDVFKGIVRNRRQTAYVDAVGSEFKSFVQDHDRPISDISVLYIDPPWVLCPGARHYSSADEINAFLTAEVWGPLDDRQTYPSVIVLKLPHDRIPNIASWPKLRANYVYYTHYTPKPNFTAYILRRV